MTKNIFICLLGIALIACKQNQEKNNEVSESETINISESIEGNYVDSNYNMRVEGYDWIAATVKNNSDNTISISIRSRADKKRPTCTFDTKAFKSNDSIYESYYEGKKILFTFSKNAITISGETKDDENILYFFCSGGASISGTFTKINSPLDSNQIDKTSFSKVLNLQDIGFNISSIEKNGANTLTVFTFGLEISDFNETFNIGKYEVLDAEIEDLNLDGSPDLIVYTQDKQANNKGNIHAFSVNNKKSMSMVYFEPTDENIKINDGYKGRDEFTLVENTLVQRFPVYKKDDSIDNPTGGNRQITYKLVDGEAMRKLEVNKISSY